jgi:hypothetical protein
MDKELEQYYNNFFELFRTEGWKQLLQDITASVNNINSVGAVKDADDLFFRKGQLVVLSNIINLEASINTAFEELTNNAEDV